MPFYVYIMANDQRTVLYTGMANDLRRRATEHRERIVPGFTHRYNCTRLVFFEECADAWAAIEREKQIKGGSRAKKVALIVRQNPEWRDLYETLGEEVDTDGSRRPVSG